ncbi:MAG: beta-mannosidase [Fibrobacteraceae bacterium]|nr:beta-mannosidase [Fibrobacteraceae bacterium]
MKQDILFIFALFFAASFANAEMRYEAEDAIQENDHDIEVVSLNSASGGEYVKMNGGTLVFTVNMDSAGFYTLWMNYGQPNDSNGKIQNLSIGTSLSDTASVGQISFPYTETWVYTKASRKIKLAKGTNVICIVKSWGWVNLDYIEITPFESTPFEIPKTMVTDASESAKKIFSFLLENFGNHIVSGVMTNTVMQNDGHYTPDTMENQTEIAWINSVSGKMPALIGLDFLHATGLNSTSEWHQGYTKAVVSLAKTVFRRGGIPAMNWHWKDPTDSVEAFYTASSGNTPYTTFNLNNAFVDSTTYAEWDTTSREYKAIIQDMDVVAGYLKDLQDSGVAILWRPLHEASGKWFWWGYRGAGAAKALYKLMFNRFTNTHGLNNLIWVWTTDEAGDALNWYPGDGYVDIIGRDYYYYPRIANHSSLMSSFENLKDMYGAKKLIALSENGSVPYPDNLVADAAGWSYFMPWYGDYTMDGWAHDNTAKDWNIIMNHDYVITLDKMPGWDTYVPGTIAIPQGTKAKSIQLQVFENSFVLTLSQTAFVNASIFSLDGKKARTLLKGTIAKGTCEIPISQLSKGKYILRVTENGKISSEYLTIR